MNDFDLFIFLAILLSMLLSYQPKRTAIAGCALIVLSLMVIDQLSTGWGFYYAAIVIEFTAFIIMLIAARYIHRQQDRNFFRIMAAFFWAACVVTTLFTFDYIKDYADYYQLASLIALLHVVFMLVYSDGLRIISRNVYATLFGNRRSLDGI